MNSPSPTSQPSVNLLIASSSALSRSVFASAASPIKSGVLPARTAALAPAPGCLQRSRCHRHLTRARSSSAFPHEGSPDQSAFWFTVLSFLCFSPLRVSVYLGDLVSLSLPDSLRSSGLCLLLPLRSVCRWQLPRLEAASRVSPALSQPCLLPGSAVFLLSSLPPRSRNWYFKNVTVRGKTFCAGESQSEVSWLLTGAKHEALWCLFPSQIDGLTQRIKKLSRPSPPPRPGYNAIFHLVSILIF